ncbi:MAG: ECF transporter S component [Clostridia bacterium]|nr:ECF transporter S component [Clostridia bacterium]MBR6784547.1 ECF transporter S component [Clostridia bacterium]
MAKGKNAALARLLYSAMFLALGLLLPFLTAQIKPFGSALCPMHLPVLLCGFICGPYWGMAVGIITPILRSVTFGMPVLMPDAVAMAFELAAYAFIAGMLYKRLDKNMFLFYVELITAMVCGRLVWGLVTFAFIFLGMANGTIGISIIWTKTVLQSIPGIVLQLVAIPPIINVLRKNRLMLN